MQEFKSWFNIYKKKILILFSLLICLIGVLLFFVINNTYNAEEIEEVSTTFLESNNDIDSSAESKIEETLTKMISVDVKGAVTSPGVYQIEEGSRVIDAIKKAGGLTKNAYTRNLNLSKILKDENVILINTKAEIDELLKKEEKIVIQEVIKEIPCESISNACINEDVIANISESERNPENSQTKEQESNKFVNINTANLNELMTLNGIGEAKAKSIIEYRESNGYFKSIEDIKNISGIGDKMYEKIKDYISIE